MVVFSFREGGWQRVTEDLEDAAGYSARMIKRALCGLAVRNNTVNLLGPIPARIDARITE